MHAIRTGPPTQEATPEPSPSSLDGAAMVVRALTPPAGVGDDSWPASNAASPARLPRLPASVVPSWSGDFTPLPEVGGLFVGFRLLAELGRGTFGRVYLGRQPDLADRLVALKVSTETYSESQRLARLQHTHIVPVHSLHRAGPLFAVCMPYYGSTTLADVLHDLGQRHALPESGKGLISTLEDRKSRTRVALDHGTTPPPPPRPEAQASHTLRHLEGLSYVDAVLWVASCLVDGLAHAHDRGIIHRDLKPANVLLTDDGQPMLLDFNLADDEREVRSRSGQIGGTLPYMSPEHLAAFAGLSDGPKQIVDARTDLYAMGVILFELLTGRHPFVQHAGPPAHVVPRMIDERLRPPPRLRGANPALTPAVEAIVRRCLEPDPARRYATARQLREDLERHLNHLPLAHTPEPSLAERLSKWSRRHPRLGSTTTVAAVAGILVLTLLAALVGRNHRLARLEAEAQLGEFRGELRTARLLLAARTEDAAQRDEGRAAARRALGRFGVLDDQGWREHLRHLPAAARERLPREAGELLLLLATASEPDEAAKLHDLAADCFPPPLAPRALWQQKAELLERLGRRDEAAALARRAEGTVPRGTWDRYLVAVELAQRGQHQKAIRELRDVLADDPEHFAAWFLLGNCCLDGLAASRESEAVGYYTACVALRPGFHGGWFNRGLAYLRLGRHAEAEADFTRALKLRATLTPGLVNRALAREGQGKRREALDDLDRALEQGGAPTRLLLTRARLKLALGDPRGARADRVRALTLEPRDEEGWVARGVAKVTTDTTGALADLARAVRLNPRSLAGWQNQAHVLSERLGRTREAVDALARILALHPDHVTARASRGVLLARLDEREAALADAKAALRHSGPSAEVLFQVAGIYALCSQAERHHRDEAITLLARALKGGFGHDLIDSDDDLAPLREDDRFRALVRAARLMRDEARGKR